MSYQCQRGLGLQLFQLWRRQRFPPWINQRRSRNPITCNFYRHPLVISVTYLKIKSSCGGIAFGGLRRAHIALYRTQAWQARRKRFVGLLLIYLRFPIFCFHFMRLERISCVPRTWAFVAFVVAPLQRCTVHCRGVLFIILQVRSANNNKQFIRSLHVRCGDKSGDSATRQI